MTFIYPSAHIQNGRTFQHRGRGGIPQFVHEFLVRHDCMLRIRPPKWRPEEMK
jgi:hypothetical protein